MTRRSETGAVIPLTILTGFLGAGKTTLLNRILNGEHGLRVAVLVNDFGAINIDAELVVGVERNVLSLANGCVCCSIRDDLIETVLQIIDLPEAPEYILLEASGVADPSGITITFMNPGLRDRIRLDSVTCVVDAEQVLEHQDYPAVEMLKLKQIGFADLMILNKVDLAGPEQVQRVRGWVNHNFNRVRIVEANHCDVPLELLLAVGRFDLGQLDVLTPDFFDEPKLGENDGCSHEDHGRCFETWTYETDIPLDIDALKEMVKRKLLGSVYRCKGFVQTTQEPGKRTIVQCVGRRTDVTLGEDWRDTPARTRIVAIGAPAAMAADTLQELFDGCHKEDRSQSNLTAR